MFKPWIIYHQTPVVAVVAIVIVQNHPLRNVARSVRPHAQRKTWKVMKFHWRRFSQSPTISTIMWLWIKPIVRWWKSKSFEIADSCGSSSHHQYIFDTTISYVSRSESGMCGIVIHCIMGTQKIMGKWIIINPYENRLMTTSQCEYMSDPTFVMACMWYHRIWPIPIGGVQIQSQVDILHHRCRGM